MGEISMVRRVARKLRSAARMPGRDLMLAITAWLLLWPARLAIRLVPLRHLSKIYGKDQGAAVTIPFAPAAAANRAEILRRAIALAVRNSPDAANCYPQALVAHLMLRFARIPHTIFFGLKQADGPSALAAHAWVMVGPVAVCGQNSFGEYRVVRSFVS